MLKAVNTTLATPQSIRIISMNCTFRIKKKKERKKEKKNTSLLPMHRHWYSPAANGK